MAEYTIIDNEFIPTWDGNLEKREAEQIRVTWSYPSGSERAGMTKVKNVDGKAEVELDYDSLAKRCIRKVENLTVNGKKITNGYELARATGMDQLYDEISTHIMSETQSRSIDSKNS